jgi:RHS repeat-associated protein
MLMPGRKYSSANGYRYGFNGKENDKDVAGDGNQYDYGFRIYNPRIGKFLSVDPLTSSYPWYTPYQFAGNKPSIAIDLDGLEEFVKTNWYDVNGKVYKTTIEVLENGPKQTSAFVRTINNHVNKDGTITTVKGTSEYLSALDFSNKLIGHPNTRGNNKFDTEKHDNPVMGDESFEQINKSLFTEFMTGNGSENTVIYGGNMIDDIKKLPDVVKASNTIYKELAKGDGQVKAGEILKVNHTMTYGEGFFEIWVPGALKGGAKPEPGANLSDNPWFSTQHFLGSYTLTGTLLQDGNTIMWALADSKTKESATDHQSTGNSIDRTDGTKVPMGSTYQRYVWFGKLYKPITSDDIKPATSDNANSSKPIPTRPK